MNIVKQRFEIRHAIDSTDRAEGLVYINEQYQKAFGVSPSPPDHLLIAWNDSRIVGTIGINEWNESTGLRLAKLYSFDHHLCPFPIDLLRSVEFARWTSQSGGVACTLLHAATEFSLARGKKYVWCEHSPAVNRICRIYGIAFFSITDAILNQEAIEDHHRAFYDSTDVHLHVFILEQAHASLTAYLERHAS